MQHPQTEQCSSTSDAETSLLPQDDQRAILQVAAATIIAALAHPRRRSPEVDPRQFTVPLQQLRGTFTTLHCQGELRGCRGSIVAAVPLIVDVARSARAAAFFDERFPPVSPAEIGGLELHVSILSTPQPLPMMSESELLKTLRVGHDGLIVRAGCGRRCFCRPCGTSCRSREILSPASKPRRDCPRPPGRSS